MDIQLISGDFKITEIKDLLAALFNAKIAFHENKIRTIHETEEDIKHSEKRIRKLQETFSNTIRQLKENGQTHAGFNVHIEITTLAKTDTVVI